MKKLSIFVLFLIFTNLNSCKNKGTCLYYISFTNKSDNTVQFQWFARNSDVGETFKVRKGKSVDFSFWTDENWLRFFPSRADSIIVTLENGKKIIEAKTCDALVDTSCKYDSRSFFNPTAYTQYKNGYLNKSCGGKEYIFTNEDAARAK